MIKAVRDRALPWGLRLVSLVVTGLVAVRDSRPVRALRRGPLQHAARLAAQARRAWRRSLQLRIVSITLVLSALLVGVFGFVVASRITGGLLDAKVRSASRQVDQGVAYAASQLKGVTQSGDPALLSTVPAVVVALGNTAQGGQVQVVMRATDSSLQPLTAQAQSPAWPKAGAYDVVSSPRLVSLREEVARGKVARQWVTADPDGTGEHRYLVFGSPVSSITDGGQLELYYLFPLDNEVATVDLVRTTLFATGVALVGLLAMVAALITRLVVRPVRLAARTAQRLSAGLLDQRMEVHGEDDLARLAASFNQMAANLQRQIVRLEEMSRLQRRFTSDVSHELRTPLTTVRMAADLIFSAREAFDPAVARSAELLQAELDRFEGLLADLLEISRFDAGFAMLDAEPTDLVPVVRRAADGLASVAERAGCLVEVGVPAAPVIAEIDPRRVERILRNLVGNAIEHSEGRPVRVTLSADESAVAVTVRDHGVGLRPGEEKFVFNRFWRADPSRARQTGGSGLGLSISIEDARLHGGWLEAWGAPGRGAQFRLTLPVRAGDRLVSSPLGLVPGDAWLRAIEGPEPAAAPTVAGSIAATPTAADTTAVEPGIPAVTADRRGAP
ncbi:HAMP domain-containing histidine kinase [Planosporangium mesophilum]|nr:MtrAB system histidine kinase MtrB [Planosporangium mesophilum]NJC84957.1 HAMP domain-containing histidine kinase [Planosporangium mesophilum]